MFDRSKVAILAVCGVALAASAAAWVYQRGRAARPLEFWGADAGLLVASAPRVEALLLGYAGEKGAAADGDLGTIESGPIEFDGARLVVLRRADVSTARGITNVRRALLDDGSFAWDASDSCRPEWTHALRFSSDDAETLLLLSFDCPRATTVAGGRTASIAPSAAALREFLEEQFQAQPER